MEITNRLLLKCINKEGASLKTYETWQCGDGCCSGRQEHWLKFFDFLEEVEVDPFVYTWDGVDLDDFYIDSDLWEILEIPRGHRLIPNRGDYNLEWRPSGE